MKRIRLSGLIAAAGAVALTCTVAGFGGAWWWGFDLAAHFRGQYFIGLTAIAGLLALGKQRLAALVMLAGALVNLAIIAPCYFGASPIRSHRRQLRAVLCNVHTPNQQYDRVLEFVRDADFIVLEEVNDVWLRALTDLRLTHPHAITEPREDNFGIALFSRWPLSGRESHYVGEDVPTLVAQADIAGQMLTIVATHPVPPIPAEGFRARNAQLEALPEFLRDRPKPILLLGDLNVTPWSPHFRRLLRETGLRDARRGFGVCATWPTMAPPLLVPIDHGLVSPEIRVTGVRVGPDIRSDHFPLVVEFAF